MTAEISPLFFYLFGGVAIACAMMVVLMKNPVTSAFNLVLVFFALSAIYALMGAHLIAALQILVYAGAVMVLFVFVIMLLNASDPSFDLKRSPLMIKILAPLAGLGIFAFLVRVFKESDFLVQSSFYTPEMVEAMGGNSRVIARLMFSEYILPFEATSLLLLAAIVGTVAIAMRKKPEKQKSAQLNKEGVSG